MTEWQRLQRESGHDMIRFSLNIETTLSMQIGSVLKAVFGQL